MSGCSEILAAQAVLFLMAVSARDRLVLAVSFCRMYLLYARERLPPMMAAVAAGRTSGDVHQPENDAEAAVLEEVVPC